MNGAAVSWARCCWARCCLGLCGAPLATAILTAALALALTGTALLGAALLGPRADAPSAPAPAARHVVVVGISGLTWSDISAAGTPELWRLAQSGSAGSLVDYAQQPLACPSDGWLMLNSAARAQGPRPCAALPAVVPDGAGAGIPAMSQIIADNQGYHESPDWGLLGSLASCSTAVGPGAALALASAAGTVAAYGPSPAALSPSVLARCPLTVIDLGQLSASERGDVPAVDRALTRLRADLPAGTLLLVTAPGAAAGATSPHLLATVADGPGYGSGLLASASTRHTGTVTLTDLTPTIAGWLGRSVPAGTVGAQITRAGRPAGGLGPAVSALSARDNAEQVWLVTHGWFFLAYTGAAALSFGIPVLVWPGGDEARRRARARGWRVAGVVTAAVPLGSYLANLFPWWTRPGAAGWLYGLTAAWTLVVAAAALAGPWRRDRFGPFGAVCAATAALLAVDVMTGSRLQLDAPFGLSLLVSGRYYGIGNDALGLYCVSTLVAAAWIARLLAGRADSTVGPAPAPGAPVPGPSAFGVMPACGAAAVGLVAVVASGWPGFGAKTGGTIALVPCLILLVAWLAGAPVGRRWGPAVAVSGLALFLVFALAGYLLAGAGGGSDLGAFAGDLLHGRAGDLLARKVSANVASLTLSVLGWLVPAAALAAGAALWRPAALRLRTLADGFAAQPLLRVLAWLSWLVLVIGWLADDSGVVVPAVALPFAVPLIVGLAASFPYCRAGQLS